MSEELKQPSKCRECGGKSLTWAADKQNNSGVQNGRLSMHDVRGIFVLGCNDCSATLAVVSADNIAAHLNTRAELSAIKGGQQPASWQFFERGKWWNGDDRIKDHRANTEAAGYPVRDLYAYPPVVAEAESVTEVMRFQLKHPLTGETHTVEFTRAEVADGMEDSLYEKLAPLVCDCDGEADHECGDYIHDFDLSNVAPPASVAVPVPRELLKDCRKELLAWVRSHGADIETQRVADELRALLAKGVQS